MSARSTGTDWIRTALLTALALVLLATAAPATADPAASPAGSGWQSAWTAAPLGAGTSTTTPQGRGFTNQTVRNVVSLNDGGHTIRVRLSNHFSPASLRIGTASVAARTAGAAIGGPAHPLTFGGSRSVLIPAGQELLSDPLPLRVAYGNDLAVSIYLPEATGPTTWHQAARATSYVSTAGDHTADRDGAAYAGVGSWFYLSGIEVLGSAHKGTVVALGDSITDGYAATVDADRRYTDYLVTRMESQPRGLRRTIVNQGIGGNRLLTDSFGAARGHESALRRFDRDVLGQPGVDGVIVLFGTNDLASYGGDADGNPAGADDLVRAMQELIARGRAHGVRVIGGTIIPFGGSSISSSRTEQVRTDVNTWIRRSGAFDGVADFDAAVRDPARPTRLLPAYDSGDHVHPSDAGNAALAGAVDLRSLVGRGPRPTAEPYLLVGDATATQPLLGGRPNPVRVRLGNFSSRSSSPRVSLGVPAGWTATTVTPTLAPGETREVELSVTPPVEPSSAVLTVQVEGAGLTIGHPTLGVLTAPSGEAAALALDGGPADSPVLTGYQRLAPDTVFAAGAGYGWLDTGVDSRDRAALDDLRRDFTMSTAARRLRITVPPGTHDVYTLSGDAGYAAAGLRVSEGGVPLAAATGPLAAGEFEWLRFTLDGGTTGRTVDLTLDRVGSGNWRLNALVVV